MCTTCSPIHSRRRQYRSPPVRHINKHSAQASYDNSIPSFSSTMSSICPSRCDICTNTHRSRQCARSQRTRRSWREPKHRMLIRTLLISRLSTRISTHITAGTQGTEIMDPAHYLFTTKHPCLPIRTQLHSKSEILESFCR